MAGSSRGRILWINTGGTLVARAYADPYNPPETVETLPLGQADGIIRSFIEEIGRDKSVDLYNFGANWDYDPKDGTFLRDSKKFNDDDIADLAQIIRSSEQQRFLISHGTDWMAQNAQKLKQALLALGVTDKTVVFAGAMMPLSMRAQFPGQGDAEENITFALDSLSTLEPGVYVTGHQPTTMEPACFDPEAVKKEPSASRKFLKLVLEGKAPAEALAAR